jgi:predicted ATPase
MITAVEIKNFKSLKHVALQTRNLNLLTGLNGSGKSSLIQVFLLLKQSPYLHQGKLNLKGELFDAGVAEDVYYQFGTEKEILINVGFTDHRFQKSEVLWHFICDPLTDPDANLLKAPENPVGLGTVIINGLFNNRFEYLTAERTGPQNIYTRNADVVENRQSVGIAGQYAVHFLHRYGNELKVTDEALQHPRAKSELLIHQADAWMSEIAPGVQLYTEEISNEEVRLSFQFGTERGKTNRLKPKNVGFGLTYVLPVIVVLLTATPDKLILIENPESHIHPRGQVELGRLLAGCAQSGAQLFIETHSDHILNGLRLAVREKLIDADKAVSFFFKRDDEDNASHITPIVIDPNGKLHRQTTDGTIAALPKGFFDQWTSSMAKLF